MCIGSAKVSMARAKAPMALRLALALLVLAGYAASAGAESQSAPAAAGGSTARAALDFKIVIPSVLFVDGRTGVVYSNDRRARPHSGSLDKTSGARGAIAMLPAADPRALPGARQGAGAAAITTPAGDARVYCLP